MKYTFLKLDPAWRRLDDAAREQDKRECMAACEDFADGHLLQAFSLIGTRGDAELLVLRHEVAVLPSANRNDRFRAALRSFERAT